MSLIMCVECVRVYEDKHEVCPYCDHSNEPTPEEISDRIIKDVNDRLRHEGVMQEGEKLGPVLTILIKSVIEAVKGNL